MRAQGNENPQLELANEWLPCDSQPNYYDSGTQYALDDEFSGTPRWLRDAAEGGSDTHITRRITRIQHTRPPR
jgi:hypothetical protein